MIETKLIQKFTANTSLMALLPGGFWADGAPRDTAYPHGLIIGTTPGRDEYAVRGDRLTTKYYFQIKVITQSGNYKSAEPIAQKIDELLRSITRADGVLCIVRQSRLKYIELDGDTRYNHLGGIYMVLAEAGT